MARQDMLQRLHRYNKRQPEPRWGRDYQAAILATPSEAPSISRATILRPELLGGRDMHLLSTPETEAAFLALYHPAVWDIHEQKVLSTVPTTHPLFGHPLVDSLSLSPLLGTVNVAHRLGVLNEHPKLLVFDQNTKENEWVPFPFVGDLLLYLRDDSGPYCVNWTIKLTEDDFRRRGPRALGRVRSRSPDPGAEIRHRIEADYYWDAQIRTVPVTRAEIDRELAANLRSIFGWHAREPGMDSAAISRMLDWYRDHLSESGTAHELTVRAANTFNTSQYQAKIILYRGVWKRHLLVDLYTPFLIDCPLRPMQVDPMSAYKSWFER